MPRSPKARYWILTIPHHCFTPFLPVGVQWIRGQLESGGEDGYLHWQISCSFTKQVSLLRLREIFGPVHCEVSRSSAADEYVWKEETCVSPSTR